MKCVNTYLKKWGRTCAYCGASNVPLEIEHIVPKSRVGRVAVRASGSFNIKTSNETIHGISHKYCQLTYRGDGYAYSFTATNI